MSTYTKKITLLSCSLAMAGTLCAAGAPHAAVSTNNNSGFYVNGNAGYARTKWQEIMGTQHTSGPTKIAFDYTQNANGGFTFGGDAGYNIYNWLGVEFGGQYLPQTKITASIKPPGTTQPQTYSDTFNNWALYLAGKLSHRFASQFEVYSKVGLSYQKVDVTKSKSYSDSAGIDTSSTIGPYFAAGVSYYPLQQLSLSFQYARIAGQANHTDDKYSPNPDLFTVNVGYHF